MKAYLSVAAAAAMIAACSDQPASTSPEVANDAIASAPAATASPGAETSPDPVAASAEPAPGPEPTPPPLPPLIGERVARAEWAKADNRDRCAPVAFSDDAGGGGTARRANFAGGWAVAFDLPDLRSAYGVAGPGLIAADDARPMAQRERLAEQWPYFRDLSQLPQPAFAGYGLVGAEPYPRGEADVRGPQSLAYVRIGGERCTYNVWSRLGRTHLESLIANLRMLPQ